MHRRLTEAEASDLRARFWPKHRLSARDLGFLVLVPAAGLVLSTPFAVLFFSAARFLHGEPIEQAIRIGLLGFLPGVVIGVLVAILGLIGANRPTVPGLKWDLARGECILDAHRATRGWRLVDDGNTDDPDLLLDLGHGRLLAIPAHEMREAAAPRQLCTVSRLPRSGLVVSVSFTGDPIRVDEPAVVTENLWRNDDLPWYEPISLASAPGELRAALEGAS